MSNVKVIQEATKDKEKGLEHMSKCIILFKCTPSYEEAIPYFKTAANGFKAGNDFLS